MTRAAGAGGPDANGRRRAAPVRRDRTTWMLYGQLALYGYFLYGFGPTVPLLRDELGVSRAVGALHATAMAAGAVLGGLLSERVVASQGRRRTLWTGVWLLCAGIVGYCSGRVLGVTLLSAALCSLAGTLIINSVNATVMDHHGPSGPAALSQANAGAGAAGIVAPLAVGGAVALGLGWRVGLLAALPWTSPSPARSTRTTTPADPAGCPGSSG